MHEAVGTARNVAPPRARCEALQQGVERRGGAAVRDLMKLPLQTCLEAMKPTPERRLRCSLVFLHRFSLVWSKGTKKMEELGG